MSAVKLLDNNKLIFAGQISQVRTMSDKTLRVQIDTQEFPPAEGGFLLAQNKSYIGVIIKTCDIDDEDVEISNTINIKAPPPAKKKEAVRSPSQQLRDVIWQRWRMLGEPGDFDEEFYPSAIDSYINFEKIQIEDIKKQG